jgi:hypothetical protein
MRTIWLQHRQVILRSAAKVQLPFVGTWHKKYRTRYFRCRIQYLRWQHYSERKNRLTKTIADNICAAFDRYGDYDLVLSDLRRHITELEQLVGYTK